jgi:plastocyanin
LVLAASVAGCGGADVVSTRRTLKIALTEYRLEPQNVRVSAGELTITVRNFGRQTHNLVLARGGLPVDATRPIWPGGTATLKLQVSRGTYLMTSTILSDQVLGTYGTLVVR